MANLKLLIALILFLTIRLQADNVIIIPLNHAPEEIRRDVEEEYKKKWDPEKVIDTKTPAEMSKKLIRNGIKKFLAPSLSGFMIIYGGYIQISDQEGVVSFPLRHADNKIYLAITPEIKLVKVKENTFSHLEYHEDFKDQTKLYSCEKKQDEKEQFFWEIKEIPLPSDNKIDPITLVILSKPRNIFVQEGHFRTEQTNQLILPELYILGNTDKETTLLKSLDLKRYFESIKLNEEKVSDTVVKKIISNI